MNRLVHVTFGFAGVPKMRDLEPVITSVSEDWIRFSTNNWLLWTSRNVAEIYSEIVKFLDSEDQLLINPVALHDSFARFPPWVWEWLNKKVNSINNPFVTEPSRVQGILDKLVLPPPKPK